MGPAEDVHPPDGATVDMRGLIGCYTRHNGLGEGEAVLPDEVITLLLYLCHLQLHVKNDRPNKSPSLVQVHPSRSRWPAACDPDLRIFPTFSPTLFADSVLVTSVSEVK